MGKNQILRESMAEFLATFFLTVCGDAVIAVLTFQRVEDVAVVAGPLGWSFAVMIVICIAGGVSGAHANPALTVAFATAGKCQIKKVLPYMIAQYCGGFVGAAVVYLVYRDALESFDGGIRSLPTHPNATAQIFSCYPQDFASVSTCIIDQVVGTSLLLIMVCAVSDDKNLGISPSFQPLFIGFGLGTILIGFGYNCMAPLNPARDLGPRLFTYLFGWGSEVFSYRNYKWFWIPIVGPHIGAILGVWSYRMFIGAHCQNCESETEDTFNEDAQFRKKYSLSNPTFMDCKY